ncbi:MAG: peptidylprolyl isomerase [Thiogranum sp.]|nr:peptidylprolyl isomerase [Thiogranum sp.]
MVHKASLRLLLLASITLSGLAEASIVRMDISWGGRPSEAVYVELHDSEAPVTVANFKAYIDSGGVRRYDGSFLHRSVPGFVIQGGGYAYDPALGDFGASSAPHIPVDDPIVNEFSASRSNVRGTIAMAKLGGDPDSATSEWFFNLADNSGNLDSQNGGFTVFGRVLGDGMNVIDAIAALDRSNLGGAFSALPLDRADPADPVTTSTLVVIERMVIDPPEQPFADIDADGIPDSVEAAAPNGGDGNNDGIPDAEQENVASLLDPAGQYITVESDPGTRLVNVRSTTIPSNVALPTALAGGSLRFTGHLHSFTIEDVPPGGTAKAVLYLSNNQANTYFKYNPVAFLGNWFRFDYNPRTGIGAVFEGNQITLHFKDGAAGDLDGLANGIIVDPGGPAILTPDDIESSGGGGCSLSEVAGSNPQKPVDLILLLVGLLAMAGLRARLPRRCTHRTPSGFSSQ